MAGRGTLLDVGTSLTAAAVTLRRGQPTRVRVPGHGTLRFQPVRGADDVPEDALVLARSGRRVLLAVAGPSRRRGAARAVLLTGVGWTAIENIFGKVVPCE